VKVKDMDKLDVRQELLVITMEECGELIQACSKLLRRQEFSGNSKYISNFKRELADVFCMIGLAAEFDLVSYDEMENHVLEKRKKLSKWTELVNPNEFIKENLDGST
tara:strand:- start:1773 stop:2093 length:321 start_codon:yes stop_codon:yes gene_type:complete